MPIGTFHFGLDGVFDDVDRTTEFLRHTYETGKRIRSYYGYYYLRQYGKTDVILSCTSGKEDHLSFKDVNMMVNGFCVWELKVESSPRDSFGKEDLYRYITCTDEEEKSLAVIRVLDSEVFPSFVPGARINLQMIALPNGKITFFDNEEAYRKESSIEIGSVLPYGLLLNDGNEERSKTMIIGKIIDVQEGNFQKDDGTEMHAYLILRVDTCFGDLDLIQPLNILTDEQRERIREGCIVQGICELIGDAAINDYEDGCIFDPEHNFKAFHYALYCREPERAECLLRKDVSFEEKDKTFHHGRDTVLRNLRKYSNHPARSFSFEIARVKEVPEGSLCRIGERILVLYGTDIEPRDVFKVSYDETGMIEKIESVIDSECVYEIDEEDEVQRKCIPADPWIEIAAINKAYQMSYLKKEQINEKELLERSRELSEEEKEVIHRHLDKVKDTEELKRYAKVICADLFLEALGEGIEVFEKGDQYQIRKRCGAFCYVYDLRVRRLHEDPWEAMRRLMSIEYVIAKEMVLQRKKEIETYRNMDDLSMILMKEKNYEEAGKILKNMVVLNSLDASAWYRLGDCYRNLKQATEARNAYGRSYYLNKDYRSLIGLISSLEQLGKREEAEEYRKVFTESFPDLDPNVYLQGTYKKVMVCRNCGRELDDECIYCPDCGTKKGE